jgi:nitroreductase
MDIEEAIKKRRSIRKYALDKKGRPENVDEEDVLKAIDLARYAPMAGNFYSVRFILVSDREKIKKIAEAARQDFIQDAAYVLVVCSDGKQTERFYAERAERYLRQQAGAAIQNILLGLTARGLACVWVGHFYDDGIKEILKIPTEIVVEALIPIAKPLPSLKLHERRMVELRDILFFDEWKGKAVKPRVPRV